MTGYGGDGNDSNDGNDTWRVTGGPFGFTGSGSAQARKWKIEKTTTVHGPAVGRTFSNYESARQFVANRVSKGEKEKK